VIPIPPAIPDPGREPDPAWLDDEHVLEPLNGADPDEVASDDPIVVDATGRTWRLRYRPAWVRMLTWAAPMLVGLALLTLLLLLRA